MESVGVCVWGGRGACVWDMTEKLSPTEDVNLSGSESHLPVSGLWNVFQVKTPVTFRVLFCFYGLLEV